MGIESENLKFSDRHATDDRDKVYGLLSLVKREQRYIKANYELDVFATYRATALALIGKGGSLSCWAGDQKRKFHRGLPSWIPDWSTAVDPGDKRRMDLFESYNTNGDWTLRVIDSVKDYWDTVKDQIELLINSPVAEFGRLPMSLGPFLHQYVELLMAQANPLNSFKDNAFGLTMRMDKDRWGMRRNPQDPEILGLDSLPWALWPEITSASIISCLSWCQRSRVYPRTGVRLLKRWKNELENTGIYRPWVDTECNTLGEALPLVRNNLFKLQEAIYKERLLTGLENAQCALNVIESIVMTPGKVLGTQIGEVIHRCWKLSDLCKTDDNTISPAKLFQVSYSLQGSVSWLTQHQYKRDELNDQGVGLSWRTCPGGEIPERVLPIQTFAVDNVVWRGARHFGWADNESGLTTLVSWLYSWFAVVVKSHEEKVVRLNHERLRQFAKTIIGGMYRSNGSYLEADDSVLDALKDWLQQCLKVDSVGRSEWPQLDPEKDEHVLIGRISWVEPNEKYGAAWVGDDYRWPDAAGPSEGLVRRSLATIGFPVPPSPFFEDIQIATDGRVFFLTQNGSTGLGPASMQNGDEIHVLPSGSAHFVLRSRLSPQKRSMASGPDTFELVGDCYLHTEATRNDRRPARNEPAVEGSLPFEMLGVRYLEKVLPKIQTVWLL